jgi:hypothetical protein
MIRFKDFLLEALTAAQKKDVDTWTAPQHSFSDHLFNNDPTQMRAYFDLENPKTDYGHRKDIEKYLANHKDELKITDYVGNKAVDKYGRERSIASILADKNAPEGLKDDFDNDPSRQNTKTADSDKQVVISRHPHDVAGMTSEGHSWPTSCMNFTKGMNRHYLPKDVEQGTHVAYLINKNDPEILNPYARIAIKPFIETDTGEKILRPESRTYGAASDKFTHTVNKIIAQNFPGQGFLYQKHSDLYNDDGNRGIVADNDKAVSHYDASIRKQAASSYLATEDQLRTLANDQNRDVSVEALKNKNAPSDLLDSKVEAYKNYNTHDFGPVFEDASAVASNPRASRQNLRDLHESQAKRGHRSIAVKIMEHPRAPKDILTEGFLQSEPQIRKAAAENKNLPLEAVDKFFSKIKEKNSKHPNNPSELESELIADVANKNGWVVSHLLEKNKKIKPKHLMDTLELFGASPASFTALNHPAANEEVLSKGIEVGKQRNNYRLLGFVASNKKATKANIHDILSTEMPEFPEHDRDIARPMREDLHRAKIMALDLPNFDSDHIDQILDSNNSNLKQWAVTNPKATESNLSKAIRDSDSEVVRQAFKNKNITEDHINYGLDHEDDNIQEAAISNPNATPNNIKKAIDHPNDVIGLMGVEHPNASDENLNHALDKAESYKVNAKNFDDDKTSRHYAVTVAKHDNAKPEHLTRILNNLSNDNDLDGAVAENKNATPQILSRIIGNENYTSPSSRVTQDAAGSAVANPNASVENLHQAIDVAMKRPRYNSDLTDLIAMHPNANSDHIDRLVKESSNIPSSQEAENVYGSALASNKISSDTLKHIISTISTAPTKSARYNSLYKKAIRNPNFTSEHARAALDREDGDTDGTISPLFSNGKIMSGELDHILKNPNKFSTVIARRGLGNLNPIFTNSQNIVTALDHPDPDVRIDAVTHPAAKEVFQRTPEGKKAIDKALSDPDQQVRFNTIKEHSHVFDEDHLHKIIDSDDINEDLIQARGGILEHPKLNNDHINKMIERGSFFNPKTQSSLIQTLAHHPTLSSDNIHRIIDKHEDPSAMGQAKRSLVFKKLMEHKNFTIEHADRMLNRKEASGGIKTELLNHRDTDWSKQITPQHIDKALDDDSVPVNEAAAMHPNASSENLTKALNSDFNDVRKAALENPNANQEHFAKGLSDENEEVRALAANKTPSNDHLSQALNDFSRRVRRAAAGNENLNDQNLDRAISDPEGSVVRNAINSHNNRLTDSHISKILDHEDIRPLEEYMRFQSNVENMKPEHITRVLNKNDRFENQQVDIVHNGKNLTPEHINTALDNPYHLVRQYAIYSPKASAENITKALVDEDRHVRESAISHPNATAEHVTKALDDSDPSIRFKAIRKTSLVTPEHINKALDDPHQDIREEAISRPNATSENITKALDNKDPYIRRLAMNTPATTEEHITKGLNDEDSGVRFDAIRSDKVTPEHITKALDDKVDYIRQTAIRRDDARPDHITKALDDKDMEVRLHAIKHPKVTPEHITKALDDKDSGVRFEAIKSKKITPEHITKALDDEYRNVRMKAIQSPKVTPEHITKALDDKDMEVRFSAIQHPKVTPEHITKALDDDSGAVREHTIRLPNITLDHITKALDDKNAEVRYAAMDKHSEKVTPEHITKALDDDGYFYVREAALRAKNLTADHITKALDDPEPHIRTLAIEHPSATAEHVTKALDDSAPSVRRSALDSPHHTEEHITKALNDKNEMIRQAALESPKVNMSHLEHAMKDSDEEIRRVATNKRDRIIMGRRLGQVNENLNKWFKEKWVRFGPDGKIRGDCARGSEGEGKPKCLPISKAQSLGKEGRASAARRKRREDPNPERKGRAKNVATTNEAAGEKDACYRKVRARYKVWPSAYASGALVQCRKKGADNWGNKVEESNMDNRDIDEASVGYAMRDLAAFEATRRAQMAAQRLAAREKLLARRLASSQMLQQQRAYVAPEAIVAEGKASKFADVIIEKARKQTGKAQKVVKVNTKPELKLDIKTGSTPEQIGSDQAAAESEDPNTRAGI